MHRLSSGDVSLDTCVIVDFSLTGKIGLLLDLFVGRMLVSDFVESELAAAGTLLTLKALSLRVGVLDLTNGEPTPHGSLEIRARETAAATNILELDWRENLGLPNRSLEPTLAARRAGISVARIRIVVFMISGLMGISQSQPVSGRRSIRMSPALRPSRRGTPSSRSSSRRR